MPGRHPLPPHPRLHRRHRRQTSHPRRRLRRRPGRQAPSPPSPRRHGPPLHPRQKTICPPRTSNSPPPSPNSTPPPPSSENSSPKTSPPTTPSPSCSNSPNPNASHPPRLHSHRRRRHPRPPKPPPPTRRQHPPTRLPPSPTKNQQIPPLRPRHRRRLRPRHFHASELNVRINLPLLPNQDEAATLKQNLHDLTVKADKTYEEIRNFMLENPMTAPQDNSDPRDYILDLSSEQNPPPPPIENRDSKSENPSVAYLSIHFKCCSIYAPIYKIAAATAYTGHCPRCHRPAQIQISPHWLPLPNLLKPANSTCPKPDTRHPTLSSPPQSQSQSGPIDYSTTSDHHPPSPPLVGHSRYE